MSRSKGKTKTDVNTEIRRPRRMDVQFVAKPSVGTPDPEAVLPVLRNLLKARKKSPNS